MQLLSEECHCNQILKLVISAHKKLANEDQADVYSFFTNGVEEPV
jgi:hypothetical protein